MIVLVGSAFAQSFGARVARAIIDHALSSVAVIQNTIDVCMSLDEIPLQLFDEILAQEEPPVAIPASVADHALKGRSRSKR